MTDFSIRNMTSRSPIYSSKGVCSSSQPLASAIGISILQKGGTAADAAVAMAAALNVTEPCSTGIGGDAFALYYDASNNGKVTSFQGNGATSADFTLELLAQRGYSVDSQPLDPHSGLCVTVPGAAMLWEDLVKEHGKLSMIEVLEPAIKLGREGFPIGPITAKQWTTEFLQGEEAFRVFRPNGANPVVGQMFKNPDLANTFESVANHGVKNAFYSGTIADAIVEAVAAYGGVLNKSDLQAHKTAREAPISAVFKGIRVYETPPPTHGLAALIALSLIDKISTANTETQQTCRQARGSIEEAHVGIECMRLAFADALRYICDPKFHSVPVDVLLSDAYISERVKDFDHAKSNDHVNAGDLSAFENSDTVYFCVVDSYGNGCSMINSNYQGFGVGVVPKNCGFTLHNRGHNFSLIPGHRNVAAPRKRPYHTIIPGLATREGDGSLYAVFGNMGAFMQPQGHTQLIRNVVQFKMDPQSAVDSPRWMVQGAGTRQDASDVETSTVKIEDGYGAEADGGAPGINADTVAEYLKRKGHNVLPIVKGYDRYIYGRAQIIVRDNVTGVLCSGSEPRADGCAMPQF